MPRRSIIRQGPTVLDGGVLDNFSFVYHILFFSPLSGLIVLHKEIFWIFSFSEMSLYIIIIVFIIIII